VGVREAGQESRRAGQADGGAARRSGHVIDGLGDVAAVLVGVGLAVVATLILRHRIFVSHDTVSNDAHVWYVAKQIWHAHRLPFAMPIIGHGQGLAFPYAFVPWLTAALAWPLFGEWAVTLWLVLGLAGVVFTTFWAFPELRRGWWAAAVLANPALVLAPIVGQLPFLWATAFLLAAVACWRRGRRGWATALAALAQITHPALLIPITAGVVVLAALREPDRRPLLIGWCVSVVAAVPAALLVFLTPAFRDTSTGTKVTALVGTVAMRAVLVGVPFVLLLLRRHVRAACVAPLLFLLVVLPNGLVDTLDTRAAWRALELGPDVRMLAVIDSPAFVPGATYRVLRAHDSKMGMYQLIQHGARLDSEFFPESIVRRSWPDTASYARFLAHRHVDYVVAFDEYQRYGTDELALLRRMTCVSPVLTAPNYTVYRFQQGGQC
jgi:hypothetical protein